MIIYNPTASDFTSDKTGFILETPSVFFVNGEQKSSGMIGNDEQFSLVNSWMRKNNKYYCLFQDSLLQFVLHPTTEVHTV